MSEGPAATSPPGEPRWRMIACFLLTLAAIQLCLGNKIQLSQWRINADENAGVAEGESWLHGRLDIPQKKPDLLHERMHDTALYKGKVYNVFPPMMGFLTVALSPLHRYLIDRTDCWLPAPYTILVFWPLPILGFILFRRRVGDSAWAGLLTLAWLGGTALLPNLAFSRGGQLGQIYHVLSQTGLLLIALDLLGRRRIWPALIGLAIAAWTRQMTLLYALPLLWIAFKVRRVWLCLAGIALIVAPMAILNQLKFGSPWDFGYGHIYVGREESILTQSYKQYGLFNLHFITKNLYYMHLAPPRIDDVSFTQVRIVPANLWGTSIWITSPILIFVLLSAPRWLRNCDERALMLGSLAVMLAVACYHNSGFSQDGYSRFALDFLPIWLAIAAPHTRGRWRTWLAIGCIAWSLLYFQEIVPNQPATRTATHAQI